MKRNEYLATLLEQETEALFRDASKGEAGRAAKAVAERLYNDALNSGDAEIVASMHGVLRMGAYLSVRNYLRQKRRPMKGWNGSVVSPPEVVSHMRRNDLGERVNQLTLWVDLTREEHAEFLRDRRRHHAKSQAIIDFHRLLQAEWKHYPEAHTAGEVVRLAGLDVPDEASA